MLDETRQRFQKEIAFTSSSLQGWKESIDKLNRFSESIPKFTVSTATANEARLTSSQQEEQNASKQGKVVLESKLENQSGKENPNLRQQPNLAESEIAPIRAEAQISNEGEGSRNQQKPPTKTEITQEINDAGKVKLTQSKIQKPEVPPSQVVESAIYETRTAEGQEQAENLQKNEGMDEEDDMFATASDNAHADEFKDCKSGDELQIEKDLAKQKEEELKKKQLVENLQRQVQQDQKHLQHEKSIQEQKLKEDQRKIEEEKLKQKEAEEEEERLRLEQEQKKKEAEEAEEEERRRKQQADEDDFNRLQEQAAEEPKATTSTLQKNEEDVSSDEEEDKARRAKWKKRAEEARLNSAKNGPPQRKKRKVSEDDDD